MFSLFLAIEILPS